MIIGIRAARIIWLKRYAEIIGGIVLFVIGFHILWEHGALEIIANWRKMV
jgi:putative Mn2+ efflux pump MntP